MGRGLGYARALAVGLLLTACGSSDSKGLLGSAGASCDADTPCSAGYCDSTTNVCVSCLFDSQCGNSQVCLNHECVMQATCETSLDCANDQHGLAICDPNRHRCVECAANADCGAGGECVNQHCVAHPPCKDSRDCDSESVCDTAKGWCVECIGTGDCPTDHSCVNSKCALNCVSDNQCTARNQLCDKAQGHCVDCLDHSQCPADHHCAAGTCEFDVCAGGTTSCEGNSLVTCSEAGDGFSDPVPCTANQTCSTDSNGASCKAWVCQPSTTECEAGTDKRVRCAADGLSIAETTDCAASGQHCFNGECNNQLCEPDANFCDGKTPKKCDSTGQKATPITLCNDNQYCDAPSLSCKPQVCTPGAAVCNGNTATICNADGSGYVGGTDCSASGQGCSAGACVSCPSPADALRIVEVHYGVPDYVMLKNTHTKCYAETAGIGLRVGYMIRTCSFGDCDEVRYEEAILPSRNIPPEGVIYVTEQPISSVDVAFPLVITWTDSQAGMVSLCNGACSATDGTNIVDVLNIKGNQPTIPLPPPVTFGSPLVGLGPTGTTTSFLRKAFAGQYPDFKGADWTSGSATRPDQ
ncbi:MAG: hypothetical protein H6718_19935 [Polyangiaceae bacterium]|nr:hypothetical protein [Polyangiaceae bacterium]